MSHPYEQYESTKAWKTIDKAVSDLVQNKDIDETTAREYIVGYLCKMLYEKNLIAREKSDPARKTNKAAAPLR